MKYVSLLFFFVFSQTVFSQTGFTKDSLSVSRVISFQQKADFKDYQVQFKDVVSDSRCPKDVMCVRAGEAKVALSIYKEGVFIKDKEIIIDASGFVIEANNLAFDANDFKVYGMTLKPYPKTSKAIPKETYSIEVIFQPKTL
ncbi:hypothetical protein [uncultured Psychroserpens sp.]|uniref:hypothetical protein n=1 Tax=uncultured Psychroserpens sp. TaxID=255436 RepID=UPI00261D8767|nr:hypothetical protein [uncultured Psychroserpens sp.]